MSTLPSDLWSGVTHSIFYIATLMYLSVVHLAHQL